MNKLRHKILSDFEQKEKDILSRLLVNLPLDHKKDCCCQNCLLEFYKDSIIISDFIKKNPIHSSQRGKEE